MSKRTNALPVLAATLVLGSVPALEAQAQTAGVSIWTVNPLSSRMATLPSRSTPGTTSPFAGSMPAPEPGTYQLRVVAFDAARANLGAATTTVTVP